MNDLLTRLDLAQSTHCFSPALIEDLRTALVQHLPATERRTLQQALIRQAGELLQGTPWQKAEQLTAIIRRWSGRSTSDPVKALLYRATQTGCVLPTSTRQIYRLLTTNPFICQ